MRIGLRNPHPRIQTVNLPSFAPLLGFPSGRPKDELGEVAVGVVPKSPQMYGTFT